MRAEILCVGTELLLGDIVNTNAAYIARELANIGINVFHQSVVGDNNERLAFCMKQALDQSDIVITTGGLGPTYDDLTKETVAKVFDKDLVLNQELLDDIKSFFDSIGRPMSENNIKQAMMPKGAKILKNSCGTAPGFIVEDKEKNKRAIMLPVSPREMKPMFENEVLPYLLKLSNQILKSHNIHIFGVGEAALEQVLRPMMQKSKNPTIAPYAKEGEVLIRVTALAKDDETADKLINPIIDEINKLFGNFIYGIDIGDLQTALVKDLYKKKLKIATAESCTGGLLSKRITDVAGASAVFECSVCSYSNDIKEKILGVKKETLKKFGAVSSQTAKEMANGIRILSGSDIGVSITGLAGPGNGGEDKSVGLVYIGIDSELKSETIELNLSRDYPNERELIRYLASSHALYLALRSLNANSDDGITPIE